MITLGTVVGATTLFLVGLVGLIVLEEAASTVWSDLGIDPISRLAVGLTALTGVGAGLLEVVRHAAERVLTARRLAVLARAEPDVVPPTVQRQVLTTDVAGPLLVLGAALLLSCGLTVILAIALLADSGDTAGELVLLNGTLAVGALLIVAMIRLRRRGRAAWSRLVDPLIAHWSAETVTQAKRAEVDRRAVLTSDPVPGAGLRRRAVRWLRRSGGLGAVVAAAGAAIFMGGVALRQPCRTCDQISYGTAGESAIDGLVLTGGSVVALGLMMSVLSGLSIAVTRLVDDRQLARAAGDPAHGVPPIRELRRPLLDRPVGESVGMVLGAVAAATLLVATSVVGTVENPDHPLAALWGTYRRVQVAALGLAVLALLCAWGGLVQGFRLRRLIRTRWSPGDPQPLQPQRPRRRSSR